mmetsp:Transcript_24365/g.71723  ORF Transcript_24365/g.71723 Transcript_24365/m.71723 type:complete len:101 (-) Transcript_24365:212-514(-)
MAQHEAYQEMPKRCDDMKNNIDEPSLACKQAVANFEAKFPYGCSTIISYHYYIWEYSLCRVYEILYRLLHRAEGVEAVPTPEKRAARVTGTGHADELILL